LASEGSIYPEVRIILIAQTFRVLSRLYLNLYIYYYLYIGQKARVSIARALLAASTGRAQVILMDDPWSAVDGATGNWIFERGVLGSLKGCLRVIALNSHHHLLSRFDRVIMLEDGCIVADGPPGELGFIAGLSQQQEQQEGGEENEFLAAQLKVEREASFSRKNSVEEMKDEEVDISLSDNEMVVQTESSNVELLPQLQELPSSAIAFPYTSPAAIVPITTDPNSVTATAAATNDSTKKAAGTLMAVEVKEGVL
jgi:ABC-type proline/glycine betaine transport system ATPase subunit